MIKRDHAEYSRTSHGDMPFLVPLLDLTMILLFFFVIMSNAAQNVFDIKLPSADKSYKKDYIPQDDKDEPIKILIKNGTFMLDEKEFTNFDEFKGVINKIVFEKIQIGKDAKDIKMTVASSKDVDVQTFLKVMTFLKSTGLEKVDIIMNSGES